MKNQKKLKPNNKEQLEIERLKSIVKQMPFDNIAECTEYYYNEFGKLKVASPKFVKKNFFKKIGKILEKSFMVTLSSIVLIDKKKMQEVKDQIANTSSQITIKPITQPTQPQLASPINEPKLLNNTQGES